MNCYGTNMVQTINQLNITRNYEPVITHNTCITVCLYSKYVKVTGNFCSVSSSRVVSNHSRQKPLPPLCKCQTWLHSHMDTSRSSAGVQNEHGVVLPKHCVRGGGVVCLVCLSTNISRPRHVRHSTLGSTSSICHTDQVVIGHLLFITKSPFTEDLATNIVAQALTHDGSEEFWRHWPSWFH